MSNSIQLSKYGGDGTPPPDNYLQKTEASTTYVDKSIGELTRYDLAAISTTGELDLADGNIFSVDATTARTISFANAPGANRAMTVVVHITGNSAVTWPSGIDWDSDAAPELGDNETKVVLFWDGVEWSGFVRVAK